MKEKVQMISPSLNSKTEHPYLKLCSKMRRFHLNFNNLTENSSCLQSRRAHETRQTSSGHWKEDLTIGNRETQAKKST